VPGGDKVRSDAIATFTASGQRGDARSSRQPSTDPAELKQALAGADAPLEQISKVKFLAGLDAVPALGVARRQARAVPN